MQRFIQKFTGRERRHRRVRAKVVGTADRPRLTVFRSAKHMTAQLIDDTMGTTIAMASDMDLAVQPKRDRPVSNLVRRSADGSVVDGKVAIAQEVGKLLAERATAKGIHAVVFDRGGYAYHGRVQAVAEGARAGGLIF